MSSRDKAFQQPLNGSPKTPAVLYPESEKHELGHVSQTLSTELTETPGEARHRAGEAGVVMLGS